MSFGAFLSKAILTTILFTYSYAALAQVKIGNNPNQINSGSILELESSNKAFVLPRLNNAEMRALTPLNGALVFNTDEQCLFQFNANEWSSLCTVNGIKNLDTNKILIGNINNVPAAVQIKGDINLTSNGTATITKQAIDQTNIAGTTIAGQILQSDGNGNVFWTNPSTYNLKTVLEQSNDANSLQIKNLGAPTDQDDATTKDYVDNQVNQLNTLPEGNIFIGNANEKASAKAISGDATLTSDGSLTISNNAITTVKIVDNGVNSAKIENETIQSEDIKDAEVKTSDIADKNVTATKIKGEGTNGQVLTTDGSGNASWTSLPASSTIESDNTIDGNGTSTSPLKIANNGVSTTKIADDNVTVNKIEELGDAQIIVGDGATDGNKKVVLSGDVTMDNAGAVTIGTGKITTTKLDDDSVTTDKIKGEGTNGQVLTTNGTGAATWATLPTTTVDDVTIEGNGTSTSSLKIKDAGVTTAKIADDNITVNKIEELGDAQIIVGDGATTDGNKKVALSGDATMDNAGAVTIGNGKITTDKIANNNVTTAKIADDNVTVNKIEELGDAQIIVGDGATDGNKKVVLSGDVTMDNAGAVTIGTGKITTTKLDDDSVTTDKIKGEGTNGQVLTTNGTGAATWATLPTTTVDDVTIEGNGTSTSPLKIKDAGVTTAKIADDNITVNKIEELGDAQLIVGDGATTDGNKKVALSGDATMDNAGAVTIGNGKITTDKIANNNVTTAKIADDNVTVNKIEELGDAQIIVGDGATDGNKKVVLSGDATMDNAGVVTIGTGKITTAKLDDDSVTTDKIKGEGTNGQVLTTDGVGAATWTTLPTTTADNVTIEGNGTSTSPLKIKDAGVTTAKIADDNVTVNKIEELGDAQIIVGDGATDGNKKVVLSGDATMDNAGTVTIGNGKITTAKIADDNVTVNKIEELGDAQIIVGDGATDGNKKVALSGDATMDNTGAVTIGNGKITTAKIADDNVTVNKIEELGDAQIIVGDGATDGNKKVVLSGDATMDNAGTVTIGNGKITTAKIADDNITVNKIEELGDAQIIVGDGATDGNKKVALSGDATMDNTGAVTIGNGKITTAKIADDNVTVNKIEELGDAQIIVGDGATDGNKKVVLSGDVTMDNAGAVTIGTGKITTTKLDDDSVTTDKIKGEGTNGQVLTTNGTGAATWATLPTTTVDDVTIEGNGTSTSPLKIKDAGVTTAKIADDNVTVNKIEELGDAQIIVGDGATTDGNKKVALSGDATMDNAGAVTIGNGKITTDKIANNNVTTAKIADDNVTVNKIEELGDAQIIVGDGATDGNKKVVLSGDVTMDNAGAVTIGTGKITTTKLDDDSVTTDKIKGEGTNGQVLTTNGTGAATWATLPTTTVDDVTIEGNGTSTSPLKIKDAGVTTAKIADDNITVNKIEELGDAQIIVGDGATDGNKKVALSGDATMDNAGAVTIGTGKITTAKIADDNVTANKIEELGDAQIIVGDGATDGNKKVALSGDATMDNAGVVTIGNGKITTAKLVDDNVTVNKIEELGDAQIIVGDGATTDGNKKVVFSGDVTMDNAGAVTIGNGKITTAKIADDNVTVNKIEELGDAQIIVGDGATDGNKKVALSGDATMSNAGAVTIGNGKITTDKIADSNVTTAKISSGTANQVLRTNAAGTAAEWASVPTIYAAGKVTANATGTTVIYGASVSKIDTGNYKITFSTALTSSDYIIQLTPIFGSDDVSANYTNQTATGFEVITGSNDNSSGTATVKTDTRFMFTVIILPQ